MPKAAKDFVVGNRMIRKGEDFEIPAGEEAEFRDGGLIEGEAPPDAASGNVGIAPEPLGDGAVVAGAEPGAGETAEETQARADASAPAADAGEDDTKARKRR